ncbi:hypothetical protein [Nocardia brasiliensis]|uniref:hypothetical protein n=1 Tax=Nocardia brasiliensis TaxID=37326 RepID=UPI002458B35B|nr:hypothetical protein [Nocardia brasiliensis]
MSLTRWGCRVAVAVGAGFGHRHRSRLSAIPDARVDRFGVTAAPRMGFGTGGGSLVR